jgi:uncharacterized protein (DUF2062 family)
VINILKKTREALIGFLKQGATPHELALAISLGIVIGMFPVQGTTTFICTVIAVIFRLNLVVIQLANYLSIPLMMIMIIPFYVSGNFLFDSGEFQWGVQELLNLFENDFWAAIRLLSWFILYAIIAWLIFAPIGVFIIYFVSVNIIKRSLTNISG